MPMAPPKKRALEHRAPLQTATKRFKPDVPGGNGKPSGSFKPAYKPASGGGGMAGPGNKSNGKLSNAAAGGRALGKPAYTASVVGKPAFVLPAHGAPGSKPVGAKSLHGKAAGKKAYAKPANAAVGAAAWATGTKREQREAKRAKKAGTRKNFATIQEAVVLWEQLRPKTVSEGDKAQLAAKIMSKAKGKLVELANHHAASRVIQYVAKHGGPEVQAAVKAEVKDNVVALSKSKYGHYLVMKLINICDKSEVPDLVKQFKGHITELLRQPQGADVLVDLYDVASTAQRNSMCAEFYGKDFALFDGVHQQGATVTHLRDVLTGASAARRTTIIQQLTKYLMPVMEKAILHPPMTHRLIREFLDCAPGGSVEDVVDTLTQTGPAVLKMVHTHDGAAVVCMLLAYGSAKDRKRLVRAMKGQVLKMATNEWAYTVLATALTVVDDTSMMAKVIIAEIKAELEDVVDDAHGRKVLLQLLSPDNRRYISQAGLDMIHPPARTTRTKAPSSTGPDEEEGEDVGADAFTPRKKQKTKGEPAAAEARPSSDVGAVNNEAEGGLEERVLGVSKKDPKARRRELLGSGKASLSEALTALCARRAGALVRSQNGMDVVVEVARGGEDGLLEELSPKGVELVQTALVAEAARTQDHVDEGPSVAGDVDEEQGIAAGPSDRWEHVMLSWFGSRALRRLVLYSVGDSPGAAPAQRFAAAMWEQAIQGRCDRWVSTHAEKVLSALAACGVPGVVAAVCKELSSVLPVPLAQWQQRFVAPRDGPKTDAKKAKKQGGKVRQPAVATKSCVPPSALEPDAEALATTQQRQRQGSTAMAPRSGKGKPSGAGPATSYKAAGTQAAAGKKRKA